MRRTYPAVPVVRGNLVALPLPDRCVDLVVTYQVVEHLWDAPAYVAECARVLRGEGRLLLSTPNRPVFSPGLGRGEKPLNPFHSQEYDAEELVGLVEAAGLGVEAVLGVHHGDAITQLRAGARPPGRRPARRAAGVVGLRARGLRRRPHRRRLRPARRGRRRGARPAGDRDAPMSHPAEPAAPIGSCAIVLHTHLPWLAHHGSWPVGEEWLYQSWAASYLPVAAMLRRLADEGRRDLLTLGVTPVLAAQLDDPYCLQEFHTWLGYWSVRAQSMAARRSREDRATGAYEFAQAQQALAAFDAEWRHGASPVLRALSDSGAVELLGGPASHPFQPLLDDRVARFALDTGLDDAAVRLGARPAGIWAPECGYRPGLEDVYAAGRGAALPRRRADAARRRPRHRRGRTVGDTDVVAFGRDLEVTYRVWSPRKGYPGGRWYRDFHTYDHDSGLKPARVTVAQHARPGQGPVRPGPRGGGRSAADAADFVDVVRRRLLHARRPARRPARAGRGGVRHRAVRPLVARGPGVAGAGAAAAARGRGARHHAARRDRGRPRRGPGRPRPGLVGVRQGLAGLGRRPGGRPRRRQRAPAEALAGRGGRRAAPARARPRPRLDQLSRDALLALSSDWAFMVTKDSAAGYARDRAAGHLARFHRLADAIGRDAGHARALAALHRADDGPFAHLDARALRRL